MFCLRFFSLCVIVDLALFFFSDLVWWRILLLAPMIMVGGIYLIIMVIGERGNSRFDYW